MSAPAIPRLQFVGANSTGDYYRVNGAATVKLRALPGKPAVCLKCGVNECEHTRVALAEVRG